MKGTSRRLLATLAIIAAFDARADAGIAASLPANATGRAQPAAQERSSVPNAQFPAELVALLPPTHIAQQAVLSHPRVRGADSGSMRERAAGDRLRAGAYETHLEFGGQRSRPGAGGAPEVDWSVTISRQIRMPAKRDADLETGRHCRRRILHCCLRPIPTHA